MMMMMMVVVVVVVVVVVIEMRQHCAHLIPMQTHKGHGGKDHAFSVSGSRWWDISLLYHHIISLKCIYKKKKKGFICHSDTVSAM
jgi:hypothetical protein